MTDASKSLFSPRWWNFAGTKPAGKEEPTWACYCSDQPRCCEIEGACCAVTTDDGLRCRLQELESEAADSRVLVERLTEALEVIAAGESREYQGTVYVKPGKEFARAALAAVAVDTEPEAREAEWHLARALEIDGNDSFPHTLTDAIERYILEWKARQA